MSESQKKRMSLKLFSYAFSGKLIKNERKNEKYENDIFSGRFNWRNR